MCGIFQPWSLREKSIFLRGGVPCPPFSIAGKQLGEKDERDLFPEALRLIAECRPKAVMLENVRGILSSKFQSYREQILSELQILGYQADWQILNSSDYGVSQLRPRAILVALKKEYFKFFKWPEKHPHQSRSVGDLLGDEMGSLGWSKVDDWIQKANGIAPTLVGGSKKHGGADLGPTRAKKAWLELGVDGKGLANTPPMNGFDGNPKLTLKMTALLQGFPPEWQIAGRKTPGYRQIGNAFPAPVAKAVGKCIFKAIVNGKKESALPRGQGKTERVLSS